MRSMMLTAMLLGTAVAAAGETGLRAEIDAPATVPPGRIVRLEATLVREQGHLREEIDLADGDSPLFAWRLVGPPQEYDIAKWTFDGGRTVVFATGESGVYRFVLAAAVADPAGGPTRLLLAEHMLVVGDSPPKPPAPPRPNPEPLPDLPEGTFGLARAVYDLMTNDVPAADRSAAAGLAENYRAVAARIAAGTLSDPQEILAVTAEGNRAALGSRADAWRPFFVGLAERMQALDAAGRLAESGDYATAWGEIAAGFDVVR